MSIHDSTPEAILSQAYELDDPDKRVYLLFDYGDASFTAGKFDNVNRLMEIADLERLRDVGAIGLLTVAHWARPHLPSRTAFFARVKQFMLQIETPDRVHQLLKGLE